MKTCRYGVVFFGLGLSMTGLGQHNVEALLLLVRDLNSYTRFCARRMRVPGDVTGADIVLIWQTGYPFSVNLASGYPRYNPGEFSAQGMLERGDVDACLLVGSEGIARFSEKAVAPCAEYPPSSWTTRRSSRRSHPRCASRRRSTASTAPARPTAWTECRFRSEPSFPADYPSDCEVLKMIEVSS